MFRSRPACWTVTCVERRHHGNVLQPHCAFDACSLNSKVEIHFFVYTVDIWVDRCEQKNSDVRVVETVNECGQLMVITIVINSLVKCRHCGEQARCRHTERSFTVFYTFEASVLY